MKLAFFRLGMLNGFLPCGLVYMALTLALASGNSLNGFISMIAFGAGTVPILWGVTMIRDRITPKFRQKMKVITLIIALLVGTSMILRGLI